MSKDAVLKMIKDEGVEYVDIRFTDPRGKLQHVTVLADLVDEDFLDEGFMFDGSSIAGWKSINNSDMKLMADTDSAYIDPFYAEKTLCIHNTVVEPDTGERYSRDPRGTAENAEAYLKASGIGDQAFMGPQGFLSGRCTGRILEHRHRIRDGQLGAPSGRQGRLFPGQPDRRRAGHPRRDAVDHEAHGHEGRQAPPRGCVVPARTGPDLRHADQAGG
jgi:hypothetical protein